MRYNLTIILLLFFSLSAFSQYTVKNNDFSIQFPEKPQTLQYPSATDHGLVYQYIQNDEYFILVVCVSIPPENRAELLNSDFESMALTSLSAYLKTVGGGKLTNKEFFNVNGHKAVKYSYALNNQSLPYRKAKMFFSYTKYNLYMIVYYDIINANKFDDYINSLKIYR